MNKFSLVSVKRFLLGLSRLRNLSTVALLFISLSAVMISGCDEDYNGAPCFSADDCPQEPPAPTVASGCTQNCSSTENTQGLSFNNNDIFSNQFYEGASDNYRRGAVNAHTLRANAATTTVPLPSPLLSFPPPLYGLAQTVNFDQTIPIDGTYITSSTVLPAGGGVLGIQRQADCSFTLVEPTSTGSGSSGVFSQTFSTTTSADFGGYLHAVRNVSTSLRQVS
ncbi:MAG: hypothetical protein ACP5EP_11605 [Acidobacteriaceae bacterium]